MPLLEINNLSVSYGPVTALEDVSLAVDKGEASTSMFQTQLDKQLVSLFQALSAFNQNSFFRAQSGPHHHRGWSGCARGPRAQALPAKAPDCARPR